MSKFDMILPAFGITATEYIKRNSYKTDDVIRAGLATQGVVVSPDLLRKHRTALGIRKTGGINSKVIGESPYQLYNHPLEHTGDSCIIGDIEFPFHHADFTNRVLELCQVWGIPHLTLGGDVLHNDNLTPFDPNWAEATKPESVSPAAHDRLLKFRDHLPKHLKKEFDVELSEMGIRAETAHSGLSKEWEEAGKQLMAFQQVFSSADWVLGNHEGRLLRALQSPLSPKSLTDLFLKGSEWMRIAPYYYSIITAENGDKFRVTHPKNSSIKPASIALRLCDTKDMNIIQCHNHLLGKAISANGKYVAIETGCCVDGARLAYYSQRDTTRPTWALGATIIRGGYAWLLDDINTDWASLKRM